MDKTQFIEIGVVALGCSLVLVISLYLLDRLFEWYFKNKE